MRTLWNLVVAPAIVTALAAPAAAAPRARHAAEAPRKVAVDEDAGAGGDLVDAPSAAPLRPAVLAAAPARDTGWRLGVGVGADVPVDALNVGFVVEAPSGVRLSSSVGFLTDVFLGMMDSPGGGQAGSVLMHAALRDSMVWRTHLGFKPWKRHGLYASAGYTLCSFGGAVTSGDAMAVLLDRMLPVGLGAIPLVHMSSTLHALDLEAGWEWSIAHRFTFRTAVSGGLIVGSSTSIRVEDGPLTFLPAATLDSLLAPVERAGEAAIDKLYQDAGPIVMLTVQLQVDLL